MISAYELAAYHVGDASVVLRPNRSKPSARVGCLYAWGHGNTAEIVTNPAYWNGVGLAPAEVGIPTISGDYGGQLWGNDTAIGRLDEAWAYLQSKGAVSSQVFLLGISMGALLVLNWARLNLSKVRAICLLTPGIDLANIHDVTRLDLTAEIDAAYGGSAGYMAALPTHSPSQYAAALAGGPPIRSYYSTDDPSITPQTVLDFSAASGGEAISLGAVGHSAGALVRSEVADFFQHH